jgi:hypothetical protein
MDTSKINRAAAARCGWGLTVVFALLLITCSRAQAQQSLTLAWNPSTNSNVAGYTVYLGYSSGDFTQQFDAGTNTSIVLKGLVPGQTNYMVVKAYNSQDVESAPSNEISFIVPGMLSMAPKAQPRKPAEISFAVAPGHSYEVEASVDLVNWSTIWETSSTTNGVMTYSDPEGANLKVRFYRLIME